MKKVLITGGAGYVGSVLLSFLLKKDYDVTVVDNLIHGNGDVLIPYFRYENFNFLKGDVRDSAFMEPLVKGSEIVVHLAAIVGFPACEKNRQLAIDTNLESTKSIGGFMGDDQTLIFASTGSNYGAVDGICTEKTPLNPISLYGKTKTEAEQWLFDNLSPIVFRFATAFGLSPKMRLDLLVNDFVYQAVTNRYLIMFEKHFKRTFIHVDDMAKSFIFAMENADRMKGEAYNVGGSFNNYNKEEIALIIKDKVDYYLHFADIGQDLDKRNYEVSYDKLNAAGFECEISVHDGIDQLIRATPTIEHKSKYRNV